MQRDGVSRLSVQPRQLANPAEFMLSRCQGKTVLNVGASGGVERYFQGNLDQWLHHKLASHASALVGLDIDSESVSYAHSMGVNNIVEDDCTTMDLKRQFDVIVMSEVIEHVNSPGLAIQNLLRHLKTGGEILLTTPNPTYAADVIKAVLNIAPSVYYDHVCAFFPENLAALCSRFNAKIDEAYLFSFPDFRPGYKLKSSVLRTIGRIMPRLHSSFLVVIRSAN